VEVDFLVDAGPATYIRTLTYNGLELLSREEQTEIVSASLLPPGKESPEGPLSYRADHIRYSEPLLELERSRLMTALRNSGYASVVRDSVHAVIWPAYPDSFDVIIDVRVGPRYRFGDIDFVVSGTVPDAPDRSLSEPLEASRDDIEGGMVEASFSGEKRLKFSLLRRTLRFRPGDWYDNSLLLATKRRLDATGVFAFTEILSAGEDSTFAGATRINHRFNLQTRPRHQIRLQTFMLQRSGALADTDNELGAGLGLSYNNLNLFGGGENFQLSTNGTLAADIGGPGGYTSAQWEVTASLSYPYLTFPLGFLDRRLNLYDARTRLSISLLAARRDALHLILRGRGSARYRFELRHTRTLASYIDLMDITVSNPDTLAGFQTDFLDKILSSVEDPVQRAQIVEDYTRPQFNNALRYTFRSAGVDPFRRSEGYAYEASFEVGGNLGYLMDRYLFTPGEVEGSLPGLPFFRGNGSSARMLYRQYVRFVTDLRSYHRYNARSVLATKFILGLAQPTGRADVIPFDRRFYSGGASSIRAWRLRELGPGSASFSSAADTIGTETTNILGGEIKLEASVELRQTFARNILAADWIFAMFVDAGNVWFGPRNPGARDGHFHLDRFYKEIGIGTGIGIRLAWDYLIIRLDLAYKMHDPLRPGDIFPDKLKDPLVQFGIGHTF
jgi:outer membrane protein assembly factor BamA